MLTDEETQKLRAAARELVRSWKKKIPGIYRTNHYRVELTGLIKALEKSLPKCQQCRGRGHVRYSDGEYGKPCGCCDSTGLEPQEAP